MGLDLGLMLKSVQQIKMKTLDLSLIREIYIQ
jgi:hypothetical protein